VTRQTIPVGYGGWGLQQPFVGASGNAPLMDQEANIEDLIVRLTAERLMNTQAIPVPELEALQAARERQHALVVASDTAPFAGRVEPSKVAEWFKAKAPGEPLLNRVKELLEGPCGS
jgi:hypothetical protein